MNVSFGTKRSGELFTLFIVRLFDKALGSDVIWKGN